jgi:hypothetical protein
MLLRLSIVMVLYFTFVTGIAIEYTSASPDPIVIITSILGLVVAPFITVLEF